MPPHPMIAILPWVKRYIAARHAVDGANSGLPDNPPGALRSGLFNVAGRASVVLPMMRPSTPVASATSAMSRTSASSRSGPTFTRRGGRKPAVSRRRNSWTRASNSSIWARACNARSPGVFGDEMLTTR